MTSPLRRKHQTTARSTLPATVRSTPCERHRMVIHGWSAVRRWAVVVAAASFAAWTSTHSVAAVVDSPESGMSAVQAVNYSTGQSGGKLKWLPRRPQSVWAETTVTPVQYTAPARSDGRLRTAQNQQPLSNPFRDPFGDKKAQSVPAEPKARDSLPGLESDEPDILGQPYVAPKGLAPLTPTEVDSQKPLLEQEMAARQHEFKEGCPSPEDLKPIDELTTNITPSEGELPNDCPLGHATFEPRSFAPITYTWTASGLCHKPLYFEEAKLERYGHMCGPWVQPWVSGAHFFLTVPILPYKMGLELPNECMYTLGYYRPGSCAPYLLDPIPLSVRGALFEAGAWVGAACVIP